MARCGVCGEEIVATGCDCFFIESECFEPLGNGDEDNGIRFVPKFDPDPDNIASCGEGGLLALPPSYILDPPAVHVYRTTNQTFENDDGDVVVFNAERYDTDGMWDAGAPTRLTIVTPGVYTVTFNCKWNKDAAGDRAAWIRKNGTDFLGSDSKHAGDADLYVGHSVIVQEEFEEDDFLEAICKQDSGGDLLLLNERESPNFAAVFRRRATA